MIAPGALSLRALRPSAGNASLAARVPINTAYNTISVHLVLMVLVSDLLYSGLNFLSLLLSCLCPCRFAQNLVSRFQLTRPDYRALTTAKQPRVHFQGPLTAFGLIGDGQTYIMEYSLEPSIQPLLRWDLAQQRTSLKSRHKNLEGA